MEVWYEGLLFDIVMVFFSILFIFKLVEIDGEIYVDGGVFCNLLVDLIKDKVDYMIGVDVMLVVEWESKSLNGWFGIGIWCFELFVYVNFLV